MTQDITNAVVRFFEAVDNRDWVAAKALMNDPIHLDYSSYGAGPAAELRPSDILHGWQQVLPGFDATQHQLGPLIIETEGPEAHVRANVTATHQIAAVTGGELWTVFGSYEIGLTQTADMWRISSLTFLFKYQGGNTELPELAQKRAEA
ncbi:MAG: nuclear transport factor 2 family protein [Pseudomonadota bacterium]